MTNLALVELEPVEAPEDAQHRFAAITYKGKTWDLSHLDSFAFRCEVTPGVLVDVVVFFSCHCFTHSLKKDRRPRHLIPDAEIFNDGREERVLDQERYELSLLLLSNMARELPKRRIIVADENRHNYMTGEVHNRDGSKSLYAVFFEAARDKKRKGRVLLYIQSAYRLEKGLKKRQKEAGKVSWRKLVKAAYDGKTIRP